MAAKLTRLLHRLAMQLHLVAESCAICSFRSRRPVRKLLETPSYVTLFKESGMKLGASPRWRNTDKSVWVQGADDNDTI